MAKKKENILFVDDEETILEIAHEYFQEKGYRVFTALNGREAAKVLMKEKIDCCFTDINMPEMDGLQLAEHIWRNDKSIPVIIMTGYPSLESAISTLKHGVVDFLVKPVNLSQMEICLKRVLRERELLIENVLLKKELESKARIEKLNRELMEKVDDLNTLNRIMSEFTTIESSWEAFRSLVELTLEITHADEARFWVINEDQDIPFEVASTGKKAIAPGGKSAPFELIKRTAAEKKPLLIPKSPKSEILPPHVRSYMAIPLTIREKVFGVLTSSALEDSRRFNEKNLYYLTFMANKAAYAIENLALYENIYENLFSTLYAFVRAIEAKDPSTQQHSNRVAALSILIGKELGCGREELDILNFAGHLHDIGKIGIRDEILQKSERLSKEEFEIIKQHSTIGARIVGQLGLWDGEQKIIRHHHECFDGSGYPDGLKGEEIPFLVRILSVADVYDAMSSDRIYRKKLSRENVVRIIKSRAGTQFDPKIVEVFARLYKEGKLSDTDRRDRELPRVGSQTLQ